MATVIGILAIVVGIVVSVALHEVGHMVPARRFGVRVSQFMVGFGPTIWSKVKGETEYGFKWIPLGGYVRLVGMYPPAPSDAPAGTGYFSEIVADTRAASCEEIRPGEEHRAFYNLSAPKKVIVMLGGPTMNLLIALVLFVVVFCAIGPSAITTKVGALAPCVTAAADGACADGAPVAPATAAGLHVGDEIVSYGGTTVTSWEQLVELIGDSGGQRVPVVVERAGQRVELTVVPAAIERPVVDAQGQPVTDAQGNPRTTPGTFVGVTPTYERVRVGPGVAVQMTWTAVTGTAKLIVTLPVQVVKAASATLSGESRDGTSVVSVVGVGRMAVAIAKSDSPVLDQIAMMLSTIAALNVALFVFNLIPLLPLDGGHVVNATYEGAKRTVARIRGLPRPGPADLARMMPVGYVVFFVLIAVGVVLMVADIVNPVPLI